jgi:hypothetical protein
MPNKAIHNTTISIKSTNNEIYTRTLNSMSDMQSFFLFKNTKNIIANAIV